MFYEIVSVFIGGGIGAALRFFVSVFSKKYLSNPIYGTFFVNIAGCFLLGIIFGLTMHKVQNIPQTLKIFLTVGFLGGLTTFSTFNLEIFEFLKSGKTLEGFLYMVLSCAFGLLFTYFGYLISK